MKKNHPKPKRNLNIFLVYNVVMILTMIVIYPLLPLILNYPPGSINTRFDKEFSYITYLQQFVILSILGTVVSFIFFKLTFKGTDKWQYIVKNINSLEKIKTIRLRSLNSPHIVYVLQFGIPFLLSVIMFCILGFIDIADLKLAVVVITFLTISAVISYLFSKSYFRNLLSNTYIDENIEEKAIRINLRQKILLQIIPLFVVSVLITSLLGYSGLIREKGDLIFLSYQKQLDQIKNKLPVLIDKTQINTILNQIKLQKPNDIKFYIAPDNRIFTSAKSNLSPFFIKYTKELSFQYHGHTYDYYGSDIQGAVIKLKGTTGDWIIGVQYQVSSPQIITYFIISFFTLLALVVFVLYYFSKTLSDDIKLISSSLTEIADGGEDKLNRKIAVTSNDEIGDLVVAFNKLQDLEKKHIQDKLDSLGILAGGIAHDFNNILESIVANIQVAQIKLEQGEDIRKYLKDSVETTLKAGELTRQLLTFAKGGAPIKRTVLLGPLIKSTTIFALRGSNVKVEFALPEELKPVSIDPGQITQVINNLIINAKQAMPEGGLIEISAANVSIEPETNRLPGEYVKISVRDHGPGIPGETLPKIFNPFFTTKNEGSGLGLTTSQSIIKKHNGYIEVDSKVGSGTTFYIYLPVSDSTPEIYLPEIQKEVAVTGSGHRILLMDDEEMISYAVGEMLRYRGYKVVLAKDGLETIELYQQTKEAGEPFDAVILDLTILGGMGGKETIIHLREIDPNVKAIVSSGYANDPIMAEYQKYGFNGVVVKPYKLNDLQEVLNRIIENKQLPLDLFSYPISNNY